MVPPPPIDDPSVLAAFDAYADPVRQRLLELRQLIFSTAAGLDGVGPLDEVLRWGEPSYLTTTSHSGSMLRLGSKAPETRECALYVHCQTDLIATFAASHGDTFRYEGSRALLIAGDRPLPGEALADCIALALTYKLRKKTERRT